MTMNIKWDVAEVRIWAPSRYRDAMAGLRKHAAVT
jgi:hypothetical protein